MFENFVVSFFGSLAAKYLPRFMRRSKPRGLRLNSNRATPLAPESDPPEPKPPKAKRGDARVGTLEAAAYSATEETMAAHILRAAVNSTDGKIRCTGRIAQSREGPRPMGPVSLQVGRDSIHSDTAARAIQLASAMDLLERLGYVAHERRSADLAVYRITAAGVAVDSRTRFVHSEPPRDAIPRRSFRSSN